MSARTYFTLEYGGTEKTLAAWRLSNCRLSFRSLKESVLSCQEAAESVAGGSQFAFEGEVKLRAGRTKNGANFTGGALVFIGYRLNAPASATAEAQGFNLQFADAFYLLEDVMYRQQWYSGATTHVLIGIDNDGNYVATGGQMEDGIEVAAAQSVALAAGEIDAGLYTPINERQSTTVAELLRQCARWSPDGVGWISYDEEDGATWNFQRRPALEAVSLTVNVERASGTEITPRHDLVREYCLLNFERRGDNGLQIATQIAPSGHSGLGRRGLVDTISLQGPTGSTMEAEVVSRDFDPGEVDVQAAANDYWIANTPALQNSRWRNGQVTFLGAKDASGATVDVSGYDYELVSGSLNEDMTLEDGSAVEFVKVRLWYRVSADHYDGPTSGNAKIGSLTQELFIDRVLMNAESGTYNTGGDYEPGESFAQFSGMAEYLLSCTSWLQFEGSHRFVDTTNRMNWVGTVLNLTGGDAAWASMRALVTQCDVNLDTREVNLRFGPAAHLTKGDLLDLTRPMRERRNSTPARTRTEGVTADGALQMPQASATGGDSSQTEQFSMLRISDAFNVLLDAESGRITLNEPGQGKVVMEVADLAAKEARFRDFTYRIKVGTTCKTYTAKILMTDPVEV